MYIYKIYNGILNKIFKHLIFTYILTIAEHWYKSLKTQINVFLALFFCMYITNTCVNNRIVCDTDEIMLYII